MVIEILNYGSWFQIIWIVGIASVVISILFFIFGNKKESDSFNNLVYGLVAGLIVGLVVGLVVGLYVGLYVGLVYGLVSGLVAGLVYLIEEKKNAN